MKDLIRKLHELHQLCIQIEPDSIKLYEVLSRKEWSDEKEFGGGDGSDIAVDIIRVLSPLAAAFEDVQEHFRSQLIADHIAATPDKYLP